MAGMYFKVGRAPFVSQFVMVALFTPSCGATCRWSSFSVSRLTHCDHPKLANEDFVRRNRTKRPASSSPPSASFEPPRYVCAPKHSSSVWALQVAPARQPA